MTYAPPGPPDSLHINAVVEDRDGAILLGTSAGLYRLREGAGARPQIERMEFGAPAGVREGSMVNALVLQGQRDLWLGGRSGLYQRGPSGAWRRFSSADGLPDDFINSFGRDPEGRLWLCTRMGVGRISAHPEARNAILDFVLTVKDGLPGDDVRGIWFGSDGRRWLGTLSGLAEWLPGTARPRFRTYLPKDGLSDLSIYGFAEDLAGNLWFGSRRGGVMRLARSQFSNYGESAGLILSGDETILETRGGEVCVAGVADPRRIVRCFGGQRFTPIAPTLPREAITAGSNSNQATLQDHLGDWWLSVSGDLFRFSAAASARDLAHAAPQRILAGRGPGRLFEDSRGDLWIATGTNTSFGLLRWERASGRFYDHAGALPGAIAEYGVNAFAEDSNGRVWFGLRQSGPLVCWRDGHFAVVTGMLPGPVHALHVDRANRLWIASGQGGLGRIDHPGDDHSTVRAYTRTDGLSSNEVWCLAEDDSDRIYAGTARGVDRLDPATGLMEHYSSADGLVGGDIRAALRDRRGDLWFVSRLGASRLSPVRTSSARPPVARITAIRVLGNPRAISDLGEVGVGPLQFSSNRNSIQVDFSAVEYRAPAQLRYQFQLEGSGQGWSDPGPMASVNYANLAPGRYRFMVRAINSEGLASPQPATFDFAIQPSLWRRWWFQTLAALALAGVAFGWHRIQLNRVLALERVRSGIAMDLHDDIGASLSRISVFSEVLKQRVSAADSESQRMLADMAETSRALVESMSDIVWSIDPRRDDVGDIVTRIRAFGSGILKGKGIRWILDAPPDSLARKLSAEQRRQVYLILKEAIHNVARHSHGQNASLRIRVEGNMLCSEIEDDGCGLTSNHRRGLGLESMRTRAARLGGMFEIAGRPAGGTCAVLRIPLKAKKA